MAFKMSKPTFLEAIEKHNERLDVYKSHGTFGGDVNQIRDLARIYMEYVYQGKGDVKPNLGCNDCKTKMMQRIITHRDMVLNTNGGEIESFEYFPPNPPKGTDPMYDSMKMGELKSIASKKGFNTYRKTKKEIIEWLKENS